MISTPQKLLRSGELLAFPRHEPHGQRLLVPRDLRIESRVEPQVGAVDPLFGPPAFGAPDGEVIKEIQVVVLVSCQVHGWVSFAD